MKEFLEREIAAFNREGHTANLVRVNAKDYTGSDTIQIGYLGLLANEDIWVEVHAVESLAPGQVSIEEKAPGRDRDFGLLPNITLHAKRVTYP